MSKSFNRVTENAICGIEDLSNQVRDLSYSLKAVGHLFSNANPDAPPESDELEGFGCLLKCFGEKAYQIAGQIDDHWLTLTNKSS